MYTSDPYMVHSFVIDLPGVSPKAGSKSRVTDMSELHKAPSHVV